MSDPQHWVLILVEVFKLTSALKDVQARENIVQEIVVVPNSVLDTLVTLYVESGQKGQVSTLLSQALPVIQTGFTQLSHAIATHLAARGCQKAGGRRQPEEATDRIPRAYPSSRPVVGTVGEG